MFRRILFILVFLGLGFIVWRMINPIGANNALDSLKDLPGKIFSRDKNFESEDQNNVDVDTILVINDDTGLEDENIAGVNNDELEELKNVLNKDEDLLEDALIALIEDTDQADEVGDLIVEDVVDENKDEYIKSENIEEDVIFDKSDDEDTDLVNNNNESLLKLNCKREGEIALMDSEDTKCCESLNWIYYRGDDKNAGAICFDAEKGIPQCKNQNTNTEGRYYMNGELLRKDLYCSDYFGTKYYEIEVSDDSSSLKSILKNIFK